MFVLGLGAKRSPFRIDWWIIAVWESGERWTWTTWSCWCGDSDSRPIRSRSKIWCARIWTNSRSTRWSACQSMKWRCRRLEIICNIECLSFTNNEIIWINIKEIVLYRCMMSSNRLMNWTRYFWWTRFWASNYSSAHPANAQRERLKPLCLLLVSRRSAHPRQNCSCNYCRPRWKSWLNTRSSSYTHHRVDVRIIVDVKKRRIQKAFIDLTSIFRFNAALRTILSLRFRFGCSANLPSRPSLPKFAP